MSERSVIDKLGIEDEELFDSMGGVGEVLVQEDRLYSLEFKDEVDAQPKLPVYIPGDYGEFVQVNGLSFTIMPEQVVLVPQVVKEILDNKRQAERTVAQKTARLKRLMSPKGIHEVPEYIR